MKRKTSDLEDEQLISFLKGESNQDRNKAFSFLVQRDYPAIKNFILKNSGNEEDAKDNFQEGLITLLKNIQKGSFQGNSSIKSYLFAICKNTWYQHLRKSKKIETSPLPDYDIFQDSAEEEDSFDEKFGLVKEKFRSLGNECQKILIEFYYQNRSMKELQQIFNLGSAQAAKNKKSRCLKKLTTLVNG